MIARRKPRAAERAIGRRKRPGESTPAFLARVRPELVRHARAVRRAELGLDGEPWSTTP